MKSFKRLAALILSVALVCSFAPSALAQQSPLSDFDSSDSGARQPASSSPKAQTYTFAAFVRGPVEQTEVQTAITYDVADPNAQPRLAIYPVVSPGTTTGELKPLTMNDLKAAQSSDGQWIFSYELSNINGSGEASAIKIIPVANGTATLTYSGTIGGRQVDVSIDITVKGIVPPSSELFDITTNQVIANNGTRLLEYDGVSFDSKSFGLILQDKDDPDLFPNLSEYSLNGRPLRELHQEGTDVNGLLNVRFSPQNNNGTGTLTLTALANIPPEQKIRIDLEKGPERHTFFVEAVGFPDGKVLQVVNNTVDAPAGPFSTRPFSFERTEGGLSKKTFHFALGSGRDPVRLDPNKVEFTLETAGDPGHERLFRLGADPQGNAQLLFDYGSQEGDYRVRFHATHEGSEYTTDWSFFSVYPPRAETIVRVPGDKATITAALAVFTDRQLNETNCIIELADNTVFDQEPNGVLKFNRPLVLIRGAGPGSVILANVLLDAGSASGEQFMESLTIAGSTDGSRRSGAGVTNVRGKCRGDDVLIKNFEIGMDMKGDVIPLGADVENCAIGVKQYVYPDLNSLTIGKYREYRNNDVAVEIQPGGNPNPFAMAFYYCNFVGNGKNVVNPTDVPYNFSFNYYDSVDASKFEGVTASPYYKEPVDLVSLTVPEKIYVAESELDRSLPIARDRLGLTSRLSTENFGDRPVELRLVDVDNGTGADVKTASWSFAANTTDGSAFNPAIATELEPSSEAAVSTLPSGASYQPVSFAHSGALPGRADVSVVKDADAPTQNLKLYKVVGSRLVLQPEPVVFVDGEYRFPRDGASDYLITDTAISSNNNGGGDDSDDNGGSGSNSYVSADEIGSKLTSTPGSDVSISVAGKPYLAATAFDALKKNPGKTLLLKGDGYLWSFKGAELTGSLSNLIYFNTSISTTSPNAAEIQRLTGDAEIVNVYFSHHGQLPGRATVDLSVDKKYNGKLLNFYYYNAAARQLEAISTGLPVKDGRVSVSITHCSDYILSPTALAASEPAPQAATAPAANPSTGAVDRSPLATVLALLTGLGAAALLHSKRLR